jgi:hypothetical protein
MIEEKWQERIYAVKRSYNETGIITVLKSVDRK